MRPPPRGATPARVGAFLGAVTALVLAAGCAGDEPGTAAAPTATGSRSTRTSLPTWVGPSVSASIEQLATALGCRPQTRGRAADYQQAICTTPSGRYVLNTFVSDKGQRDWLEYSKMYGGSYLVGNRWVVAAPPQLLTPLRARLGGRIQTGHRPGRPG